MELNQSVYLVPMLESDKENFDNYMAVYDIIENLFKNYKIEIVTKNGLSPYIGPTILNEVTYV
jgi:predicted nucleotidyltransferase